MFKAFLIIGFFSCLMGCKKDVVFPNETIQDVFFIAGHAYGTPGTNQYKLYKKLVNQIAVLKTDSNLIKFIFTGDVVVKATEENWDNVLFQFDSLGIDYWIAPGNHDISTDYFSENVQEKLFFSKRIDNNLFLVLNTNYAGWTVGEDQISMIKSELSNLKSIANIFVFSHQVWWANTLSAPLKLEEAFTNSSYLLEGPSSFWKDAFPLFEQVESPVYFFSGDVGAFYWIPNFYFQKVKNFYFFASGLGSGIDDNILKVKTYASGNVEIEKIEF